MPRSMAIALLSMAIASPAMGQQIRPSSVAIASDAWKIPTEGPLHVKPGFALPVSDYVASDGIRTRQQGIIVGVGVGPQTTVGIGLFTSQARRPVSSSEQSAGGERRSRKAAIGMTLRF